MRPWLIFLFPFPGQLALIATNPGSTGTVNAQGAGTKWNLAGKLSVGGDVQAFMPGGNGTLNIHSGSTVTTTQATTIFPNGIVKLQGGTLDTPTINLQGSGGKFQWTGGTLHVGNFNGNLVNQGGKLSPGHSPGLTTITGDYTQQAAGKLDMEIGGPAAFDNDLVNVLGAAALGGELQLSLINNFVPTAGLSFSILQAANLTGSFANVANGQRLDIASGLGSFQVHYGMGSLFNPNQVVLNNFVASSLPGDFNQDGSVDTADYVIWRKSNLGPVAYNIWRENFGRTASGGLGSFTDTAVPEPGAITLVVTGLIGLYPRRSKRRRSPSLIAKPLQLAD